MRFIIAALLLCVSSASFAQLQLGVRYLKSEDWEPVESQPMVGLSFGFPLRDSMSVQLGLHLSAKDAQEGPGEVTGGMIDLTGGLRFIRPSGVARPYIEGGIAGIRAAAELELAGRSEDDAETAVGGYAMAGIMWVIGRSERFAIGLEGRYIAAGDVELFGTERSASSSSLNAYFGFRL